MSLACEAKANLHPLAFYTTEFTSPGTFSRRQFSPDGRGGQSTGLEAEVGRAGYTRIGGSHGARVPLPVSILCRSGCGPGVRPPPWRHPRSDDRPGRGESAPLPSWDPPEWLAGSRQSPADNPSPRNGERPVEGTRHRTSDRDESPFLTKLRSARRGRCPAGLSAASKGRWRSSSSPPGSADPV